MTFITVVRTNTFPAGSVEVDLTGLFTGNLTGNVLDGYIVQSTQGQFDTLSARTLNGPISVSDDLCIDAANVLQVDTINDKSGNGVTIEDITILNGAFQSNIEIADPFYLLTDNIAASNVSITVHDQMIIKGNVDMWCFYLANVMGLEVNTITSKGLDVGTLVNIVSFDSPPIINVSTTGGGVQNQFWGYQNGIAVTTGASNTSQGYRALASITTGLRNVSIGNESMELAVGVNDCIAIGHRAGEAIATTSRQSIIIGSYAGRQIGTSSNRTYGSVIIGHRSLESCTERAIANTFLGAQTGLQVTASGFANTAIGYQAIQYGLKSPVVALGNYNVAIGYKSMTYGTTGQGSVAIGFFALRGNTNWNRSGQFQIGIGNQAGAYANSDYTVAIGMAAMRGATSTTTTGFTSPRSIAIGYQAMLRARSGSDDAIAIGANALIDCRGTFNIGIGRDTGSTITIGYENILIGHNADVGVGSTLGGIAMGYNASARSYSVVIGHNSQGYHYSSIVIGHGATSSGIDTITFGSATPTSATANATAWGQTFSSRAWVGGGLTGAAIDNGGNIIRGNVGGITGNLDMMCYTISNVMAIEVDTITAKTGPNINIGNTLAVAAGKAINVDTINETTAAAGVTIDGVLLRDNDVEADEVRTDTLSVKAASQITVTEDLIPSLNVTYNLGSASFRWNFLYADMLNVSSDAVILGNLTISGNVTYINTENILVSDNKILLNSGETGAGVTLGSAGLTIDRGTEEYFNLCWDETRDALVSGVGNVTANLDKVAHRVDTVVANGIAFFNGSELLETDTGFTYNTVTNTLTAANVTISGHVSVCDIKYCYEEINSNTYTILETDDILGANTAANAIVFTLPAISSLSGGFKKITILDSAGNASGNNITVMTTGLNTLLGGNTIVISGDYNGLQLISDGTSKWFIV